MKPFKIIRKRVPCTENLKALNNLAVAYKNTGQLEKAKTILNQALVINPAPAGTHYNLVVAYEEKGNIKSAIHFYQNFVNWPLPVAQHCPFKSKNILRP
jgi:tetratricopeptide (TPR) repeat protein